MTATAPGWADQLGRELAGDTDVWQRIRARGGKPFRIGDSASYATKGGKAYSKSKSAAMRIEKALGKVESDETE